MQSHSQQQNGKETAQKAEVAQKGSAPASPSKAPGSGYAPSTQDHASGPQSTGSQDHASGPQPTGFQSHANGPQPMGFNGFYGHAHGPQPMDFNGFYGHANGPQQTGFNGHANGYQPSGFNGYSNGHQPNGFNGYGSGPQPHSFHAQGNGYYPYSFQSQGNGYYPNGPQSSGSGYQAYSHLGSSSGYHAHGPQQGGGYHAYAHQSFNGGFDVYRHQGQGNGYHAYSHMDANSGYDIYGQQDGESAYDQQDVGGYDTREQQGPNQFDANGNGFSTSVTPFHTPTVARTSKLSATAKPWKEGTYAVLNPSAPSPLASPSLQTGTLAPGPLVSQSLQASTPVPDSLVVQPLQTSAPVPDSLVAQPLQTGAPIPGSSVSQSLPTSTPDSHLLLTPGPIIAAASLASSTGGSGPNLVASSTAASSPQVRSANTSTSRDNRITGASIGNARIHMSNMYGGSIVDRTSRIQAIKSMTAKQKGNLAQLADSLGQGFEYEDGEWYGKKTAIVNKSARAFLSNFFFNQGWRRALINNQEYRSHAKPAKTSPSCIAFITIQLNDEQGDKVSECCIISVSRPEAAISKPNEKAADAALMQALDECVDEMNGANPEGVRYFVASHCSKAYNEMLMAGHPNRSVNTIPEKSCAEKFFSSILDKLFSEFGDRMKVTGLITCNFYPYRAGLKSKRDNGLYDGIVDQPYYKDSDFVLKGSSEDQTNYRITLKPACKECQLNKEIHFCSWALSHAAATNAAAYNVKATTLRRSISRPSDAGGEKDVIDFLLAEDGRRQHSQTAAAASTLDLAANPGLGANGSNSYGTVSTSQDDKKVKPIKQDSKRDASDDEDEEEAEETLKSKAKKGARK